MLGFLLLHDGGGDSLEPPAAAGEQGLQGTPVAPEKIQEAREFEGYPLYWLGETFQSLNLAYLKKYNPSTPWGVYDSIDAFNFIYGTCKAQWGHEGCTPPLEIQVTPLCWNLPERFGIERGDLIDFRGAKGLWEDYDLRIWTGDSAIVIFGSHERVQLAAETLAPLGNVEVTTSDSRLPPPNFDSCPETPIYPVSTVVPFPPTPTPATGE